MSDKKGNKIMETKVLDNLDIQGKSSQEKRPNAMKRHKEKEEEERKAEEMKKMSQDAGTVSQDVRRRGV